MPVRNLPGVQRARPGYLAIQLLPAGSIWSCCPGIIPSVSAMERHKQPSRWPQGASTTFISFSWRIGANTSDRVRLANVKRWAGFPAHLFFALLHTDWFHKQTLSLSKNAGSAVWSFRRSVYALAFNKANDLWYLSIPHDASTYSNQLTSNLKR